jgi:hypothetical protein
MPDRYAKSDGSIWRGLEDRLRDIWAVHIRMICIARVNFTKPDWRTGSRGIAACN